MNNSAIFALIVDIPYDCLSVLNNVSPQYLSAVDTIVGMFE